MFARTAVVLATAALSVPLLAGAAAAADSASQQACFGQVRAILVQAGYNGETLSARKGSNATQNAEFRSSCQG